MVLMPHQKQLIVSAIAASGREVVATLYVHQDIERSKGLDAH